MRHCIDLCSVYRGALTVEGWSERGAPTVRYRGQTVPQWPSVTARPDVVAHFGEKAGDWGFHIVAVLPSSQVNHAEIVLDFGDENRVEAPGVEFRSPEDADFGRMLEAFRKESRKGGRALEIGSRARSGNTYRHLLDASVSYTGMDIAPGPNVDVVGDAHHLSRHVEGRFDFVLSISVFEHLLMPWMVALEMNKVMNEGGCAYIQSHAAWPLHEEPWDFWRYSKNAWDGIFNAHTGFAVLDKGYAMRCAVVPAFAAGGAVQGLEMEPSYLLSACLVRKTGAARVRWDGEASDVYDLRYDHG